MEVYTINADKKKLGRVATEAAHVLLGKNTTAFVRNRVIAPQIVIENTGGMIIDEKKRSQKEYLRYSGYPGGLVKEAMDHLIQRKGVEEVVKLAVYGMLPNNKLRKERMKRLTVKK